jgi:hypothetical protein
LQAPGAGLVIPRAGRFHITISDKEAAMDVDLETVDTKDLVAELASRMDCGIFVGMFERTEDEGSIDLFIHGGNIRVLGLLSYATQRVLDDTCIDRAKPFTNGEADEDEDEDEDEDLI